MNSSSRPNWHKIREDKRRFENLMFESTVRRGTTRVLGKERPVFKISKKPLQISDDIYHNRLREKEVEKVLLIRKEGNNFIWHLQENNC